MFLNIREAYFDYKGNRYVVGEPIRVKGGNMYEGLIGIICEIRTDEDKKTDILGPEIYCDLVKPIFQEELLALQKRCQSFGFSVANLDRENFQGVLLTPEMLVFLDEEEKLYYREWSTVYYVQEYICFNRQKIIGDNMAFTNRRDAENYFFIKLYKKLAIRSYAKMKIKSESKKEKQDGKLEYYCCAEKGSDKELYCIWIDELKMPFLDLQKDPNKNKGKSVMNETESKTALIEKIVDRAQKLKVLKMDREVAVAFMELATKHYDLSLERMLNGSDFDFMHDFVYMPQHFHKETGTFDNLFLPRFSRQSLGEK